ncbi:hypothetical protein SMC26_42665 [Actinomadura fulvescens]|uniref:DUF4333 domain-containing protein n=1 Tax=Actinomadura fulvescens TaxID=46160 RepID=A0ABN3QM87_9ACTN
MNAAVNTDRLKAAARNNRVRMIVLGIVALVVAGAAAAVIAYATLVDTKELRYRSQSKLLASTGAIAGAELQTRGMTLGTALSCRHMPGWTKAKMRVSCTGTTADKKAVQVFASGERAKKEHYYTILVNGRPIVENAPCLGPDCRKRG